MRNIIFLGLVSFFCDFSSEMVYPLIPIYLTGALGATPVLVGTIEGIAESTASLLKVFSGYISDKYHRRSPLPLRAMPPAWSINWRCCFPLHGQAFCSPGWWIALEKESEPHPGM